MAFLMLIASLLFAFTSFSTAHPAATASIRRSSEVALFVGSIEHIVLLGERQKLGGMYSCTDATYFVSGAQGFTTVKVVLKEFPGSSGWQTQGLSVGWFSRNTSSC